jgi:hypothetical protein
MKEDKNIEKWIREGMRMEEPSASFTDGIMQRILEEESLKDKALASLLKREAMESPAADFTSRVMAGIAKAPVAMKYPAIIGKKAWMVIGSMVTLFILYAFTVSSGTEETPTVFDTMIDRFDGAFSFQLPEFLSNPMLALSLLALSSLLFLDQLIGKKRFSYHLGS